MKKAKLTKKAPPGYVNPHADDNREELPRLQRLLGQVEGVKRMIEEGRHCYEVVNQLRAVRAALAGLEGKILENHLEHLVKEVFEVKDPERLEVKKADLLNLVKGKLLVAT